MRWPQHRLAIVACTVLVGLTAGCGSDSPSLVTGHPRSQPTDLGTWGAGPERQSFNRNERTISVANAANLHQVWSTPLGDVSNTAPVVAAVDVGGVTQDLAYVGTEKGVFSAIRVSDGTVAWSKQYPTIVLKCESPNTIGITGAAVIDQKLVYFATVD